MKGADTTKGVLENLKFIVSYKLWASLCLMGIGFVAGIASGLTLAL